MSGDPQPSAPGPATEPPAPAAGDSSGPAKRVFRAEDFEFLEELGEGSFGRVVRARFKFSGEPCAVKIVQKALLIRFNKTQTVRAEKEILNRLRHPNIIQLRCTFQDPENLCMFAPRPPLPPPPLTDDDCADFVLELAENGELFHFLKAWRPVRRWSWLCPRPHL